MSSFLEVLNVQAYSLKTKGAVRNHSGSIGHQINSLNNKGSVRFFKEPFSHRTKYGAFERRFGSTWKYYD